MSTPILRDVSVGLLTYDDDPVVLCDYCDQSLNKANMSYVSQQSDEDDQDRMLFYHFQCYGDQHGNNA